MLGQKSVFGSFCLLMILPLALFAAALAAHLGYLPLLMPRHTIIMLAVLLLFAVFFAPQNEYCQGAKLLKNSELFSEHLRELVSKSALKIGKVTKSSASFEDFFEDFLHELKPLNFGTIASAIFPMLGILGTFLSIALSMPDFSSSDQSHLEREISELLSGIATAFYVSIYGIFLSIWWMFAARMGRGKISAFKARIQRNYKEQFWQPSELASAQFALAQSQNQHFAEALKALADADFFERLKRLHSEKFTLFSSLFAHIDKACAAQGDLLSRQLQFAAHSEAQTASALENFLASQDKAREDFKTAAASLNAGLERSLNTFAQELSGSIAAACAAQQRKLPGESLTQLARNSAPDTATASTDDDNSDFSALDELKSEISAMSEQTKDLLEKISQRE